MYRSKTCRICDRWEPVMSYLTDEIASQPGCWSKAIEMAGSAESALPRPGERVAVVGCGRRSTSRAATRPSAKPRARARPTPSGVRGTHHPAIRPPGVHLPDRHHHRSARCPSPRSRTRRRPPSPPTRTRRSRARPATWCCSTSPMSAPWCPVGSSPARSCCSALIWRPAPGADIRALPDAAAREVTRRCRRNSWNAPSSPSSAGAGPPRWPTRRH